MKTIWSHFLELFFPPLCICCENKLIANEKHLCLSCLLSLPKTNHASTPNNKLEEYFAGRFPFEHIISFAYFTKGGIIQKIIHELKYKNNPELGIFLGKLCGKEICEIQSFANIDILIPVPIHKKRLRKRGYNQSLMITKGISDITGKPIDSDNLVRKINNPSQTKSSRFERWKNTEGIFEIIDISRFENKHLLLIDDVVTTGSTLEACAKLILKSNNSRISILTIGSAV